MKRQFLLRAAICAIAALAFGVAETRAQDVFQETGKVSKPVWSGYWWPNSNRSILGPLQKYDALTGSRAAAWRNANMGGSSLGWEGLCHGFAAASVMEPEPKQAVKVTYRGRQAYLSVGDQKGLLSAAHDADAPRSFGTRYYGDGDRASYADMNPVQFWAVLREYVRDLGKGVVIDAEPNSAVWNYPVYWYRITIRPYSGNLNLATLEVLMADDAVLPDFVGIQPIKQTYYFTVRYANGKYQSQTARWYGQSVNNHPDFAWVPESCETENPYLDTKLVHDFVRITGSRPEPPQPNVAYEDEDEDSDENGESGNGDEDDEEGELIDNIVDFATVVGMIENQKSSFDFDLSVEGLQRTIAVGDDLRLAVKSEREGYLYVFVVDPNGEIALLYPLTRDVKPIPANELVKLPGKVEYSWRVSEPVGEYLIKGIVLERPLAISGGAIIDDAKSASENEEDAKDVAETASKATAINLQSLILRVAPSIKAAAYDDLEATREFVETLGAFAHDEETIYVGDPETVGDGEGAH